MTTTANPAAWSGWYRPGRGRWSKVCTTTDEQAAWAQLEAQAPRTKARDLAVMPAGKDPNETRSR